MHYSFKEHNENFSVLGSKNSACIIVGETRELFTITNPPTKHFTDDDLNAEELEQLPEGMSEVERDLYIMLTRKNPAIERCSNALLTLMQGLMLDVAMGRDITWLPTGTYMVAGDEMIHIQGKTTYNIPTTDEGLIGWDFRKMEKTLI